MSHLVKIYRNRHDEPVGLVAIPADQAQFIAECLPQGDEARREWFLIAEQILDAENAT